MPPDSTTPAPDADPAAAFEQSTIEPIPVEGHPGYRFNVLTGLITAPNGAVIGKNPGLECAYLGDGKERVRIPGRVMERRLWTVAWQHVLAQRPEADQDAVWIEHTDAHTRVHGTDRTDQATSELLRQAGGFTWAPSQKAWVIPRNWGVQKRDDRVVRLLSFAAAEDRHLRILGPRATVARLAGRAARVEPPALAQAPGPTAALAADAERAEPEQLTDEVLTAAVAVAQVEVSRSRYGSRERLAADKRLHALRAEQRRRFRVGIQARPDPGTLGLAELEAEHQRLDQEKKEVVWGEDKQAVADRLAAVAEAWSRRLVAELAARPEPSTLSEADVEAEQQALSTRLPLWIDAEARAAHQARALLVSAALDPYDRQQHAETLQRTTVDDRSVHVDGHHYATIGILNGTWRIRLIDSRSELPDRYRSKSAAAAALVHRFDQDPGTYDLRTWGERRRLLVPPAFVTAYTTEYADDRRSSATPERQHLYKLLNQSSTRSSATHPTTGELEHGNAFWVSDGLMGELQRRTEGLEEQLTARSVDRTLDKSDRDRAKRQLAATHHALRWVRAYRELLQEAGYDDDRRVLPPSAPEPRGEQPTGDATRQEHDQPHGEEHLDHDQLRNAGPSLLGDLPTAGAGRNGGPGGVLHRPGEGGGRDGGLPDTRAAGGPSALGRSEGAGGTGQAGAADGGGADPRRAGVPATGAGSGAAGVAAAVGKFRLGDDSSAPRGIVTRARANLEAVKVLRELTASQRLPSEAERGVLARWSGWGAIPTLFDEEPDADSPVYGSGGAYEGRFAAHHAAWATLSPVRDELRELLTPWEWRRAAQSLLSAHYTPPSIARAMWAGLVACGFDGGEVLEPGCGTGTFFGTAPEGSDLGPLRLTGVELDPTTAAIARTLYPHVTVLDESFGDTDVDPGSFDAVIANVPFGRVPLHDPRFNPAGHSIHNAFLTKALALTRTGGVVLAITSRWTLDSEEDQVRTELARHADLLGAVRLPAEAFDAGGTDVVADVLVLRRRASGASPSATAWQTAVPTAVGERTFPVNEYFRAHPDRVLGTLTTNNSSYGPRLSVTGQRNCAPVLAEALHAIATQAHAGGLAYSPHPKGPYQPPLRVQTARDKHAQDFTGRLLVGDDGRVLQHRNGVDPVEAVPADGAGDQLHHLIRMRDLALNLRTIDRDPDGDHAAGERLRAELKEAHGTFANRWGPLSQPGRHQRKGDQPTAWGWFCADPQSSVVLGLERWDPVAGQPVISDALDHRPSVRRTPLHHTSDPKTALAAVLGRTGRVDVPAIAQLLDTTPDEARQRLGTDVFDDPATGDLVPAALYLTGPVGRKLAEARTAAATDPTYRPNVAALEAALPRRKELGEFTISFGAAWLPESLVQDFLRDLLGDRDLRAQRGRGNHWTLKAAQVPDSRDLLHGTSRVKAVTLATRILNGVELSVTDPMTNAKGTVTHVVNDDATREARQKADAMRSAFEQWVLSDHDRARRAVDTYNEVMNAHRPRSYDGQAPSLEGMTDRRTPFPHQLAGATRMLHEQGVILAHEVGTGKTTTVILGLMALQRAERVAKPCVVVPNHLVSQWADEARLLFPTATVLTVTSNDLTGSRRGPLLEYLRATAIDLVVYSREAFTAIPMSPEFQEEYTHVEIADLKDQIEAEKRRAGVSLTQSRLQEKLSRREAEIRRSAAPERTPGALYFDDLGHDYLAVDEAHEFRSIGIKSRLVPGVRTADLAIDLHQKLTWLHRTRAGQPHVTLATGTPLANSISDIYVMLRLAGPQVLEDYGVSVFDAWAVTFGEVVPRVELAPDGSGIKVVERFSRFRNRGALKAMWAMVADTKTSDDVGIERPRIVGGGPQLVLVPSTPQQKEQMRDLMRRGRAIHAGEVSPADDNMLYVSHDGRKLALDPRLHDPRAEPGRKLANAAEIIAERYHATKDHRYAYSYDDPRPHPNPGALQIVFINQGVPGEKPRGRTKKPAENQTEPSPPNSSGDEPERFSTYEELKKLLTGLGVPAEKVAFVQDARGKPDRLRRLWTAARNGEVAVLIGSTQSMGTGANIQNRAVALYHLDPDWRPADMEQRNGRIHRRGNQNAEIEIFFLGTEQSMDGWQFGLLTSKAEGHRDVQRPGGDDNTPIEEIDGTDSWDYATMQAELAGNPYIKELFTARAQLRGLEGDQRTAAARRLAEDDLLQAKQRHLAATRDAVARRAEALPKIQTVTGDDFTIRIGTEDHHNRATGGAALNRAASTVLAAHTTTGTGPTRPIAVFGGLTVTAHAETTRDGDRLLHLGFEELPGSATAFPAQDIAADTIGRRLLTKLRTALTKAPDAQAADAALLPRLESEVADLTHRTAAVDYTARIDHTRRRVHLLDDLVAAIAALDELPPPPDDPGHNAEPADDPKAAERAVRAAKVKSLQAALRAFDVEHPPPEDIAADPAEQTAPADTTTAVPEEPVDVPVSDEPAAGSSGVVGADAPATDLAPVGAEDARVLAPGMATAERTVVDRDDTEDSPFTNGSDDSSGSEALAVDAVPPEVQDLAVLLGAYDASAELAAGVRIVHRTWAAAKSAAAADSGEPWGSELDTAASAAEAAAWASVEEVLRLASAARRASAEADGLVARRLRHVENAVRRHVARLYATADRLPELLSDTATRAAIAAAEMADPLLLLPRPYSSATDATGGRVRVLRTARMRGLTGLYTKDRDQPRPDEYRLREPLGDLIAHEDTADELDSARKRWDTLVTAALTATREATKAEHEDAGVYAELAQTAWRHRERLTAPARLADQAATAYADGAAALAAADDIAHAYQMWTASGTGSRLSAPSRGNTRPSDREKLAEAAQIALAAAVQDLSATTRGPESTWDAARAATVADAAYRLLISCSSGQFQRPSNERSLARLVTRAYAHAARLAVATPPTGGAVQRRVYLGSTTLIRRAGTGDQGLLRLVRRHGGRAQSPSEGEPGSWRIAAPRSGTMADRLTGLVTDLAASDIPCHLILTGRFNHPRSGPLTTLSDLRPGDTVRTLLGDTTLVIDTIIWDPPYLLAPEVHLSGTLHYGTRRLRTTWRLSADPEGVVPTARPETGPRVDISFRPATVLAAPSKEASPPPPVEVPTPTDTPSTAEPETTAPESEASDEETRVQNMVTDVPSGVPDLPGEKSLPVALESPAAADVRSFASLIGSYSTGHELSAGAAAVSALWEAVRDTLPDGAAATDADAATPGAASWHAQIANALASSITDQATAARYAEIADAAEAGATDAPDLTAYRLGWLAVAARRHAARLAATGDRLPKVLADDRPAESATGPLLLRPRIYQGSASDSRDRRERLLRTGWDTRHLRRVPEAEQRRLQQVLSAIRERADWDDDLDTALARWDELIDAATAADRASTATAGPGNDRDPRAFWHLAADAWRHREHLAAPARTAWLDATPYPNTESATAATNDVVAAFRAWETTETGRRLAEADASPTEPPDPPALALHARLFTTVAALESLTPHAAPVDVAQAVEAVGNAAWALVLGSGWYATASDEDALDALTACAHRHAARLGITVLLDGQTASGTSRSITDILAAESPDQHAQVDPGLDEAGRRSIARPPTPVRETGELLELFSRGDIVTATPDRVPDEPVDQPSGDERGPIRDDAAAKANISAPADEATDGPSQHTPTDISTVPVPDVKQQNEDASPPPAENRAAVADYDVPAAQVSAVLAKIHAANRRAERAGISERFTSRVESYDATVDDAGVTAYERRSRIFLDRPVIRQDGWTFAAVLTWTDQGELVTRTVPGIEVTNRPHSRECEVCHTTRDRIDTYLLRHDDGRETQVGSSCLETFLGMRPEALWMLSWDGPRDLEDPDEQQRPGLPRAERRYRVETVLAVAAAVVAAEGFVSQKAADDGHPKPSTASRVLAVLYPRKTRTAAEEALRTEMLQRQHDHAETAAAIHAAATNLQPDSEYTANLRAIAAATTVGEADVPLLVSAVGVHQRSVDDRALRQRVNGSVHVGTTGSSLPDTPAEVLTCTLHRTRHGHRTLLRLADSNGNLLTCWMPGDRVDEARPGDAVLIRGRIAAHTDDRGVAATRLTRVALTPRGAAEQERARLRALEQTTVPEGYKALNRTAPSNATTVSHETAQPFFAPGASVRIQMTGPHNRYVDVQITQAGATGTWYEATTPDGQLIEFPSAAIIATPPTAPVPASPVAASVPGTAGPPPPTARPPLPDTATSPSASTSAPDQPSTTASGRTAGLPGTDTVHDDAKGPEPRADVLSGRSPVAKRPDVASAPRPTSETASAPAPPSTPSPADTVASESPPVPEAVPPGRSGAPDTDQQPSASAVALQGPKPAERRSARPGGDIGRPAVSHARAAKDQSRDRAARLIDQARRLPSGAEPIADTIEETTAAWAAFTATPAAGSLYHASLRPATTAFHRAWRDRPLQPIQARDFPTAAQQAQHAAERYTAVHTAARQLLDGLHNLGFQNDELHSLNRLADRSASLANALTTTTDILTDLAPATHHLDPTVHAAHALVAALLRQPDATAHTLEQLPPAAMPQRKPTTEMYRLLADATRSGAAPHVGDLVSHILSGNRRHDPARLTSCELVLACYLTIPRLSPDRVAARLRPTVLRQQTADPLHQGRPSPALTPPTQVANRPDDTPTRPTAASASSQPPPDSVRTAPSARTGRPIRPDIDSKAIRAPGGGDHPLPYRDRSDLRSDLELLTAAYLDLRDLPDAPLERLKAGRSLRDAAVAVLASPLDTASATAARYSQLHNAAQAMHENLTADPTPAPARVINCLTDLLWMTSTVAARLNFSRTLPPEQWNAVTATLPAPLPPSDHPTATPPSLPPTTPPDANAPARARRAPSPAPGSPVVVPPLLPPRRLKPPVVTIDHAPATTMVTGATTTDPRVHTALTTRGFTPTDDPDIWHHTSTYGARTAAVMGLITALKRNGYPHQLHHPAPTVTDHPVPETDRPTPQPDHRAPTPHPATPSQTPTPTAVEAHRGPSTPEKNTPPEPTRPPNPAPRTSVDPEPHVDVSTKLNASGNDQPAQPEENGTAAAVPVDTGDDDLHTIAWAEADMLSLWDRVAPRLGSWKDHDDALVSLGQAAADLRGDLIANPVAALPPASTSDDATLPQPTANPTPEAPRSLTAALSHADTHATTYAHTEEWSALTRLRHRMATLWTTLRSTLGDRHPAFTAHPTWRRYAAVIACCVTDRTVALTTSLLHRLTPTGHHTTTAGRALYGLRGAATTMAARIRRRQSNRADRREDLGTVDDLWAAFAASRPSRPTGTADCSAPSPPIDIDAVRGNTIAHHRAVAARRHTSHASGPQADPVVLRPTAPVMVPAVLETGGPHVR